MNAKEIVDKYYYDVKQPNSYGGIERFAAKFPNVNKKELKNYLSGEDAYTLHKPVRKKFKTRKTIARQLDQVWQLDLSEMIKYSTHNEGYQYILFVIDVYSRYLWLKPLKDKKGETVTRAVREIINDDCRQPRLMHSDLGIEFLNKHFKEFETQFNISHFHTYSVNKAAIVERVQRTIKERMNRYFTKNNTFKYIDILNDLAYSYNRSFHRTIKTTPIEMVNQKPYIPPRIPKKIKDNTGIKKGDYVRISRPYIPFRKGYAGCWSKEVFKVESVKEFPKDGMKLYYVEDLDGERVRGGFYKEEVQKIRFNPATSSYKIEKILGSRGRGKNKEFLVKWLDYPEKFNTYVKERDILKY